VSHDVARVSGNVQQHCDAASAIPETTIPAMRTTVINRLNFWGSLFNKGPFSRGSLVTQYCPAVNFKIIPMESTVAS